MGVSMVATVPSVPTLMGVAAPVLVGVLLVGLAAFDISVLIGVIAWTLRAGEPWH